MIEFFNVNAVGAPEFLRHDGFSRREDGSVAEEREGGKEEYMNLSNDMWQMLRKPSPEEMARIAETEAKRLRALRFQSRRHLQDCVNYFCDQSTCHSQLLEKHFSGSCDENMTCDHCANCRGRNMGSRGFKKAAKEWFKNKYGNSYFLEPADQEELLAIPTFSAIVV